MAANPEYVINPTFTIPAAANSISVTPAAVAWNNSAYSAMSTGITGDLYLAGVIVNPGIATDFEVDVASGGAGSEVVLGTLAGSVKSLVGGPFFMPFPILANKVTSGTRIALRHRQLSTTTTAWAYALVYYLSPLLGNVTTTTNVSKVLPSAAAMASITGNASAFVNSSWVALTASTANAIIVGGVVIAPGVASVEWELDIGTGGAGSEVVITTIRSQMRTATGGPWFFPLENPLDNIATTTRVAARSRVNSTTTTAMKVKLVYYDKPL